MAARIPERLDRIRGHLADCLARVLTAILIENEDLRTDQAIERASGMSRADREKVLAAATKNQSTNFQLAWIAESLLEIRKIVDGFDLRRLEAFRRQKESTQEIWERPIAKATRELTGSPRGVYKNIGELYESNRKYQKPRAEVLYLANEISAKAKLIERELTRLLNPVWDWLLSWRSVATLVVLALLVAAGAYVLRTCGEDPEGVGTVGSQLQRDVDAI